MIARPARLDRLVRDGMIERKREQGTHGLVPEAFVSNGPTVGRDGVVVLQAVAARKLPPGTSSAGSDVWKGGNRVILVVCRSRPVLLNEQAFQGPSACPFRARKRHCRDVGDMRV